jgi:nitroimidazol reductase NimA-like FMN-containing flavoprotein (pyridoxamine 5'-phosphate oxidase superfamily)
MSAPSDADPSGMIVELDAEAIDDLLASEVVGRIGCHLDGLTYVVPVIYAYDGSALYVASLEGKKTRMMRAAPAVCFEVDRYEGPHGWRSAIVQGRYEELEGDAATQALSLLAQRFAGSGRRPARRETGSRTVCFRIVVQEVTGRAVNREVAGAESGEDAE